MCRHQSLIIDNIAKLVLDSINGVCYEDDAQIILLSVTKVFAQEVGTLVRVD
jgi:Holliday junction resolvase RusA-like endonuclease